MNESQGRNGRAIAAGLFVAALICAGWIFISHPGVAAAAAATRYDRVFGNIYYKVPAGYRAVQQKNGIVMVRQSDLASGNLGGVLLITPGFPLDAKIKAKIRTNGKKATVQAIAVAAGNLTEDPGATLTDPQPVNEAAKDGYEAYSLISRSRDKDAGKTRFSQYLIILTGNRADVVMRVAYGSQANYDALNAGFDALAKSIEPKNSGAAPPARLAGPLPTDMAAITPKPAPGQFAGTGKAGPKPGAKGGRSCRIVQRQICSGGIGTSLGYFCNTYPQSICN